MKLFKSYSEKEVKRVKPLVDKINGLEDEFMKLTDAELKAKTDYFKKQLKDGKTLDDILPEAFAVTREASKRVLGMRQYRVQSKSLLASRRKSHNLWHRKRVAFCCQQQPRQS